MARGVRGAAARRRLDRERGAARRLALGHRGWRRRVLDERDEHDGDAPARAAAVCAATTAARGRFRERRPRCCRMLVPGCEGCRGVPSRVRLSRCRSKGVPSSGLGVPSASRPVSTASVWPLSHPSGTAMRSTRCCVEAPGGATWMTIPGCALGGASKRACTSAAATASRSPGSTSAGSTAATQCSLRTAHCSVSPACTPSGTFRIT